MKNHLGAALVFTLLSDAVLAEEKPTQQITRIDQHTIQQAPATHFSGSANFSRLPTMPSNGDIAPATVTFAPNTATNWHIHPHGQYLIVIEGEGRTQEWGKPIQQIYKGDTIWCPPGVKHWHGASEHSGMTHIALSPVPKDNQQVTWLEKVELPSEEKAEKKFREKQQLLSY
jgi:4-carboxymuconolactone decarboxylase